MYSIYIYIMWTISADLFQSEGVLDHIVIHPYLAVLQIPISHYCNTLQSPILQIAMCLYCTVHLALLHHLKGKGVGLSGHRLPQSATGRLFFCLYCTVHLALLHHLKGVGLPGHRLPQGATGRLTFWPPQAQMPQNPFEIIDNIRKSLEIAFTYCDLCESHLT